MSWLYIQTVRSFLKSVCGVVFVYGALTLPSIADEENTWTKLNGPAITGALLSRTLVYEDQAKQEFNTGGSTVYIESGPSFGSWRVSDTQYCSVWPPASNWVCYDVFLSSDQQGIRFIGESGRVYEATFVK